MTCMWYFAVILAHNISKLSKIPLTALCSLVFWTILKKEYVRTTMLKYEFFIEL